MTNDKERESKSDSLVSPVIAASKPDRIKANKVPQTALMGGDTLTIDKKAAVFYQPDSLQIEKRMKQIGETDFRIGMDDYIYSLNTSVEYFQKQGLPVLDAKNKKYLKFISAEKKVQFVKLDSLEELWGIYLFDPKKKPFAADMTIIEDEYKSYYQ